MSVQHVDHLVVGAGFAGLCAAIKLQEDGELDFLVVEKGPDVGGTWRDNTYPGAACDVPSQLYSFSFAPNPGWSMSYSPQPEIQDYLRRVAERSGTLDRFVFDTTVDDAVWDDATARWTAQVTGPDGTRRISARTLVVGAGGLSEPRMPDIEGIATFQGHVFHSARWDHSVDLAGQRVAVIGTGASAIQIVPELQQILAATGGHLDVYQRTAPWVIPRNDRRYGVLERRALRRVPALGRLYRTGIYWAHEAYVPAFTMEPRLALPAQKAAAANIRKGISDPELRAKVTPDYAIGCKRILRSNTYYPALAADNTELVTDPIAKVTGDAVVTSDGVERPVDVLVVATGFYTTQLPVTEHITGTAGRTLADVWREGGMAAY
jgi:cation diffusion facilitator CzcD-associated flavoprotein CzcO